MCSCDIGESVGASSSSQNQDPCRGLVGCGQLCPAEMIAVMIFYVFFIFLCNFNHLQNVDLGSFSRRLWCILSDKYGFHSNLDVSENGTCGVSWCNASMKNRLVSKGSSRLLLLHLLASHLHCRRVQRRRGKLRSFLRGRL